MIKRVWKIYKGTSKATKERLLGFVLLGAVLMANLSPIFAQQGINSAILSSPSSSSIISFGTREEALLLSRGECENGFVGGIVGNGVIEPLAAITTGNTGFDIACARTETDPVSRSEKILALIDSSSQGIVGGIGTATATLLQQRPLSGVDYIEQQVYALTNPGQVSAQEPPAYYRGTGFDLLRPMQSFWGWSVNIVYSLMILIVIFVAFGIIFKTSLNGGVVVALQSAIPNIVLAMVLVPLSYAITGLFVDGITVGVNAVHQFLIGNGSPGNDIYQNRNTEFPLGNLIAVQRGSSDPEDWDRGLYVDDIRLNWVYVSTNLGFIERLRPGIIAIASIFNLGDAAAALTGGLIGDVLTVLINLVFGILLLWTGARIAWLLAGKYVAFLVGPLFAPFIFATVALPSGGTRMIFSYLKTIGAASLYYIVAYAMFLLAMILASDYILVQVATVATPTFVPPMIGLDALNLGGGSNAIPQGLVGIYLTIASLVIYMLIPSTLKKIDAMVGVNDGGIMAIFNDVKKSVTDSVGMAKMWNKQVVGRAGKTANFAAVLTTGRKLNGPDGWVTNQYKRIGGNIRQAGSRLRNSNNILVRAVGAASALTVEAGLSVAETIIGGEGSSTGTAKGGKNAKITAEFKSKDPYFPMDPGGTIQVTQEGIFKIYQYYGMYIDKDGRANGRFTNNPADFLVPCVLSFKIEGGNFSDIVKPSDISFAAPVARSAASRDSGFNIGQGYNVAETFKAFNSNPGSVLSFTPTGALGGTGDVFDFIQPHQNLVRFLISEKNTNPAYQTSNKTSFQIAFNLTFSIANKNHLEVLFGVYNLGSKSFIPFNSKFEKINPIATLLKSAEYILKINNNVVNGDISSASSLQVKLVMK